MNNNHQLNYFTMKKTLFMLAVVGMAMGCSNTNVLEEGTDLQTQRISFESLVNKNTRALTNTNFETFYVMGSYTTTTNSTPIHIFNNVEVNKTDGTWTYTGESRYWIEDASYIFHAYSVDNKEAEAHSFNASALELNNYVVDNTKTNCDLVYATATATGKASNNPKVSLDFKHALAKIKFTFESEFPAGYTVTIDQVGVQNLRDKGNFRNGVWSNQERTADEQRISMTLTNNVSNEIYVLPYKYEKANARLYFRLTVISNETKETVLQTERRASFTPTWVMGCAYNYKVNITGSEAGLEKIEFTTDPNMNLDGWTTGTDDNVKFEFGADVKPELQP